MSKTQKVEPRWVIVDGQLHDVSDFAGLEKKDRPEAICPICELPVVLKLGSINVHHYAHRTEAACVASLSETALHLNTKFHLYRELRAAGPSEIVLEQPCQWCDEKYQRHVWLENWDDVRVEYRMDSIRPDIALLCEGRVIGALEVLVTHAVDDRKIAYFEEQGISWLEFSARPDMYESPDAWTKAKPLPLMRWELPYPAWSCEECALKKEQERQERQQEEERRRKYNERIEREEQERLQFLRDNVVYVAMMFDIYFTSGKKYREIFYVKKRFRDGSWIRSWVENEDHKVLFAVEHPEGDVAGNRALQKIKRWVGVHHAELKSKGHMVEIAADWTKWVDCQKFIARDIARYPFKFFWDENLRRWQVAKARHTKPRRFNRWDW
ncbi:MAG TPA: competence protein CoiA family protein [Abditibacteriaceae bacterium]|jgi:hypothetical protein